MLAVIIILVLIFIVAPIIDFIIKAPRRTVDGLIAMKEDVVEESDKELFGAKFLPWFLTTMAVIYFSSVYMILG